MEERDDNLRRAWRDSSFCNIDAAELQRILKKNTALGNLARRYRTFSVISLVSICWVPFVLANEVLMPSVWRLPLMILVGVYFLVASVMDYWLYKGVSEIDCSTMTVSEVEHKALFYRKRHLQFMIVLIPMAIALVGGMIWFSQQNEAYLHGVIFGVLVGLAVGIKQFIDFMSDYSTIKQ